ncbi:fumarase [Lactobacillus selangorensis]|uniref:Fumarate hydratase class II n=1 Tax=Lactobacillus selangorensis TaxID=81857 RepID=A0A0R2FR33_9LACO|nr:class II fumarate hydratase [Lactobacillus selangorensis]KRN27530.1 fumarase [Lactobacillus selangorensis]KRN30198.1 fumarase [Lactobacillus selangorensis]
MEKYRTEEDALGPVQIPIDAPWGPQTERSRQNFKIGPKMPYAVITALLNIKKAAAQANTQLQVLDTDKAQLIIKTVDYLLREDSKADFPLVVYQTGSGTQTNMNVNEVIVHVAKQIDPQQSLHPNDDVNHSQSSNDTFPTAMQIAAYESLQKLYPVLEHLIASFQAKQTDYQAVVKIGRTHLQDATPLTFGQEVSGWVSSLQHDLDALKQVQITLLELPIGGTAVGTGLNTPEHFDQTVVAALTDLYQVPFKAAPNKFQGLTSHSPLVIVHGTLKALAADLLKIGNDIRFLASGPRAGYDEINIPANEPGSSIMPGKVNPTQIEALTMVVARVMGNDTTIGFAASQGNFELNVYKPVLIATFLESVTLLTESIASVDTKLVQGITVNQKRMTELVDRSLMTVTALSPHIGYEKSAQIAQKAQRDGSSLRTAALAAGFVTAAQFDTWVDPLAMTNSQPKK